MTDISDFCHVKGPTLRRLVEFWLARRGDRPMPGTQDVDPVQIHRMLPHVWFCDYERVSRRFRYRIADEEINAVFGFAVKGSYLDQLLPPEHYESFATKWLRIADGPNAMHDIGMVYHLPDRQAEGERLALPLASDGWHVDGVIGATVHGWTRDLARGDASCAQITTMTPIDEVRADECRERRSVAG